MLALKRRLGESIIIDDTTVITLLRASQTTRTARIQIDSGSAIIETTVMQGTESRIDETILILDQITDHGATFALKADPVVRIDRLEIHERKQKGRTQP